jgi:SAM-dependent methyltransferase
VARLHGIWVDRYRTFSLSESGWFGAGEAANDLLYACKTQALQRALRGLGLDRDTPCSVLDAGCGQGFFADYYQRAYPRWKYTGVDLAEPVIRHLQAAYPAFAFEAADVSSWQPSHARSFDLIQSFEVLHLFLEDALVEKTIANLARRLHSDGAMLVTAVLPDESVQPNAYIHHIGREAFLRLVGRAGLRLEREYPMYYWLPDGGPANRYLRFAFARLGPRAIYFSDRLGLAWRLPRWLQRGFDSRMKLLVLRRDEGRRAR